MTDASRYKTTGDLVSWLVKFPSDTPVVLSSDSEGNGFSPLSDHEERMYYPECTWSGETGPTAEQLVEWNENPEDWRDPNEEGAVRAVVLWPVN